jgi:hypothetical protein
MSPTNLRKFREFYLAYNQIQQALSAESARIRESLTDLPCITHVNPDNLQTLAAKLTERFILVWTHYVTLFARQRGTEKITRRSPG